MIKLMAGLSALLLLVGCGSQEYIREGTPTIAKHAKRGYNKPYKIKDQWYHPQPVYNYSEQGVASFYGGGDVFHGRDTSTGEKFDMHALTAAHKTLPLPCVVRVTNLKNGRSLKLKVVDRGPFVESRIIDVSRKAARMLGFENDGLAPVLVQAQVQESILLAMNYHPKKPVPEFAADPRDKFKIQSKSKSIYLASNKKPGHNAVDQKARAKLRNGTAMASLAKGDTPMLLAINNADTAKNRLKTGLRPVKVAAMTSSAQRGRPAIARGIYIQVGRYDHGITARRIAQDIKSRHRLPVQAYGSKKQQVSGFKVLAGPFNSSEKAKKLLNRIKTVGHPHACVIEL